MKKLILTALVAVATLTANAQVWVGGEAYFGAGKTSFDGDKLGAGTVFKFVPEIGYSINDKFDVALAIGLAHTNYNGKNYAGTEGFYEAYAGGLTPFNVEAGNHNKNAFTLNPYVRYKFAKAGDFTFFVDGGFGYTKIHYSGFDKDANQWGLGFKPGISYNISDKVSLVAHVGELSYNFFKWEDTKNNEFKMGVWGSNLLFGAYVSF